MKYNNIVEGRFISRPNRFIAYVRINDRIEKVHVKNTGRCRELLTEEAVVFLEESSSSTRSTAYDLVAVMKQGRLINMDSQAPNKAVEEWLRKKILFPDIIKLKPEAKYANSRFDFYVETDKEKIFIEVKGVTLERDNAVYFPDAPSERAVKHVKELMEALREGYQAYIILVVQMENVDFFAPNVETQQEFGDVLLEAQQAGVKILAFNCRVRTDEMEINKPVPVRLSVLDRIAEPLLQWYDREKRVLPWRQDPTPYHVWVSEIMLQQTRVETVKPYYKRFMDTLPDIESLAGAAEDELLKLWEGLGYYSRVRNMQKAAQQMIEQYQGEMPADFQELMKLSGIGTYTAGAIASIAYGKCVPAVDGNVLRVLARLRADGADIMRPEVKKRVERELLAIIPKQRPGDFNQALMELGAMICTPNGTPKCNRCPWAAVCLAHRQGNEQAYPVKSPKAPRTCEDKTVLVLRDEEKIALRKRPDKGLLAGMYEFPTLEGHLSPEEVLAALADLGLKAVHIQPIPASRHIFTHKEWHMTGYAVRVDELAHRYHRDCGLLFVDITEAQKKYPIPAAYAAYIGYLNIKPGAWE